MTIRGSSGTSQMGPMGGHNSSWGARYAAELRILLVCLRESLGRLGQNGGRGHWGIFFIGGGPPPPVERRTAPDDNHLRYSEN